ncbi:MAG TPA: hypothetical protein VE967_11570 [Gemmatimonadaceae bacterium]|nr:hypothetical protein [Gemmatimonadaceae bacterium]
MDDKQLQKLIRQNAKRAAEAAKAAKAKDGRRYDPTLPASRTDDDDLERDHFFKEMKRREF